MHHVFNTELYLKTRTCFDASMHRHHQEVLLLYQSYMPVKCSPSVRTLTVLTVCRYQVGNTVDGTDLPYCMLLKFILLSHFILL